MAVLVFSVKFGSGTGSILNRNPDHSTQPSQIPASLRFFDASVTHKLECLTCAPYSLPNRGPNLYPY